MLKEINANLRAARRALVGLAILPVVVLATAVQGFIVGPLSEKRSKKVYNAIPNAIYKTIGKLLGYKVSFNKASAPISTENTWYLPNHMSIADFIVIGSTLQGTFSGKGDLLKQPGIAQMARAVKYIGLRRSREFNPQSRAKIIKNFNAGFNTITFLEGTTTDGKQVAMFHAALPAIAFGEKGVDKQNNEVTLDKDIVFQPVAIRVKSVDGQDTTGNDKLREDYAQYYENRTLTRIWKRLKIKEIQVELTTFAPLKPADFADAKALANAAATEIVSVVNPGQVGFQKAVIPGMPVKAAEKAAEIAVATATEPKPEAVTQAPVNVMKPLQLRNSSEPKPQS